MKNNAWETDFGAVSSSEKKTKEIEKRSCPLPCALAPVMLGHKTAHAVEEDK